MDGEYRLSDAERSAAVARLGRHHRAGRLSADELRERSEAARVAVTRTDLVALLRDLPDGVGPLRRGWRDRVWRSHLLVFGLTSSGVIGVWQLTRDRNPAPKDYGVDYWWPLWFGLGWAVVVLLHLLYAAGLLSLPGWLRAADRAVPARSPMDPVDPVQATELGTLTARELQILAVLAEGHPNQEIARRLHISERTARTHVSNILRKLGLSSRTQAALVANRAGLATPRPADGHEAGR